jgi:transposase
MTVRTVGLDIAKQVFQVHGVDQHGRVVLRRRLRREQIAPFFANLPPCMVGLEAWGGSSLLGKAAQWIRPQGSTVRLQGKRDR